MCIASHLFCLKQALDLFDTYSLKIAECDDQIEKIILALEALSNMNKGKSKKPNKKVSEKHNFTFNMHKHLINIAGVDLTAIPGINVQTAFKIITETGTDMSKWETSKQFASWLGVCPGNKVSGGKRLSGKTAPSKNQAAAALRMAANSLRLTDTALGAFFRRLSSRLGAAKAITAGAHKLAIIFYNMLKNGVEYLESGARYYEEEYRDRCIRNLKRRAQEFGFAMVPIFEIEA